MPFTNTKSIFNSGLSTYHGLNSLAIAIKQGYEGHPIKNETFFIIRTSVCVFS